MGQGNYSNVELGERLITHELRTYFFIHDDSRQYCPYLQICAATFEVIDAYPSALFKRVKLGYKLFIGGTIQGVASVLDDGTVDKRFI